MELINGGSVGNVINGACAAYAAPRFVGIVSTAFLTAFLTGGWGIAIGAGCLVNTIGTSNSW